MIWSDFSGVWAKNYEGMPTGERALETAQAYVVHYDSRNERKLINWY